MIFNRHANLKYKYGNRHFWARGYFVDTVGKNKQRIQEYIKRQLEQDQIADQLSLKEFTDPFTGSKGTKAQIKGPLRGPATRQECSWQTHSWPLKGLC